LISNDHKYKYFPNSFENIATFLFQKATKNMKINN